MARVCADFMPSIPSVNAYAPLCVFVGFRYDAVQIFLDILHHHFIVGKHRRGEDIRFPEHRVAVATVQQVCGARYSVLRLRVNGNPADRHIVDPARAVHPGKLARGILNNARRYFGVDMVACWSILLCI